MVTMTMLARQVLKEVVKKSGSGTILEKKTAITFLDETASILRSKLQQR